MQPPGVRRLGHVGRLAAPIAVAPSSGAMPSMTMRKPGAPVSARHFIATPRRSMSMTSRTVATTVCKVLNRGGNQAACHVLVQSRLDYKGEPHKSPRRSRPRLQRDHVR